VAAGARLEAAPAAALAVTAEEAEEGMNPVISDPLVDHLEAAATDVVATVTVEGDLAAAAEAA